MFTPPIPDPICLHPPKNNIYIHKFIWNVGDFILINLDGKMLLEIEVNLFIFKGYKLVSKIFNFRRQCKEYIK